MNERLVIWASTNAFTTWVIRNIATHVDPWLFRATNGRFTSMGAPSMPMVTLSMTGRRSGRPRHVHLACIEHAGDRLVVASAMGQKKHPGWRYNLEANPGIDVQMPGERYRAQAQVLSDDEKTQVWPAIREAIPQIGVYEQRTERNIRVFRLVRAS